MVGPDAGRDGHASETLAGGAGVPGVGVAGADFLQHGLRTVDVAAVLEQPVRKPVGEEGEGVVGLRFLQGDVQLGDRGIGVVQFVVKQFRDAQMRIWLGGMLFDDTAKLGDGFVVPALGNSRFGDAVLGTNL